MADENIPENSPKNIPEPDIHPPTTAKKRPHRPVYEPTLLPERRRRRASPWLVIPALVIVCGLALYYLWFVPQERRFVPTAGKIVFASDAGTPGQPHLWIAGPDGAGARRLTQEAAGETAPAWSPDGSQIAFLSTRAGGQPQVFIVDGDGRDLAQVTQSAGAKSNPAFTPGDNTLLGFTAGGALFSADVRNGEPDRLLPAPPAAPHDANAGEDIGTPPPTNITIPSYAWAPAKTREEQGLAAVEDRGGVQTLALMPTLAGTPHESQDGQPNGPPLAAADTMSLAWSPEGGLLAVAMIGIQYPPPPRPSSGLILLDSQGAPISQQILPLLPSPAAGPQNPIFSPDGGQIAFEIWQGPDLAHRHSVGLFSVPTGGGSAPRRLFRGDATDARFAADSQTLYFLRRRPDGGRDLCRVGADGTNFARLSDGHADVESVAVSPQSATAH